MSRQSRRARNRRTNRRKKVIRRRRIILLLFVFLLIPIIFKGAKFARKSIINITSKNGNETKKNINKSPKIPVPKEEKEKPLEPESVNVKVLSVGDIMFHMPQVKAGYIGDGKYDFSDSFMYVKKQIFQSDIAIANFKTVTAGNDKKFSGNPQFNSPKETLLAVKESGFDIISTVNNHSIDAGKNGILNTIKYAKGYGLKNIGTYEKPQKEFLIEEKNNIKLGFLSYSEGFNGLEFYLSEEELSFMVNKIDEDKIKKDIEKLKSEVDMIVIYINWGEDYQREPTEAQVDLGHKMVDWGANIIFGSHPHVLQKSEIIEKDGEKNLIVYSMGNFLSNQREETMGNSLTEDGVMVEIDIEKNIEKDKTSIKDIEFIPTWMDKYNENGKDIFRILPIKDILDGDLEINLNDKTRSRIEKSQKNSLEILDYE